MVSARATVRNFGDRQAAEAEQVAMKSGATAEEPSAAVHAALDLILNDLVGRDVLDSDDETGASGKFERGTSRRRPTMLHHDVLDEIRDHLESLRVPGAREATPASTWSELDVDSLDLVELVKALEDRFGIAISDDDLTPIESVGDAIELVVTLIEDTEGDRTLI